MSQLTIEELQPTSEPVVRTILDHPSFPALVKAIGAYEYGGNYHLRAVNGLRMNSETYGIWMTRGYGSTPKPRTGTPPRGAPSRRAMTLSLMIGAEIEREHGLREPHSLAYVIARDHTRLRLDGRRSPMIYEQITLPASRARPEVPS